MNINKYRNIGFCAHIDAGKTTTTERVLFCTGVNYKIGEVHKGEATMDFMDQEKERGITINSAVTTVYWSVNNSKYKINIIDTPGHVDFSIEVERSMKVLDGICLICCAVGGVQSQTEAIWKQINYYSIPRICFINKMDRVGANLKKVCQQIKKNFNVNIFKIHYPVFNNDKFIGIIDIIENSYYSWDNKNFKNIKKNNIPLFLESKIKKKRTILIEKIIKNNDYLINKYIENKISVTDIIKQLKYLTLKKKCLIILCGSSFKNKGIQNLLDGIINFLPSPVEKKNFIIKNNNKIILKQKKYFIGFCFKIVNDFFLGKLFYTRIYSGEISLQKNNIYNINKNIKTKFLKILFIKANKKKEKNKAISGDIIALIGLKKTETGDTLCSLNKNIYFEKINILNPVISISVKPLNKSDQEKMIISLKKNISEDPSIRMTFDKIGNTLISGMGELHLEVFIEKVQRTSNIKIIKSKPKVFYKETISKSSLNIEGKYIKQSGGRGQYGHVVLNVYPLKRGTGVIFKNLIKGGIIPNEYIKSIEKGINNSLSTGVLGYEVTDIKIELVSGSFHEVDSSENAFIIASSIAFKNAMKNSYPIILEPIMKLSIIVPIEYTGVIIGDIYSRRGKIIKTKENKLEIKIISSIPLNEVFNYSTLLRSLTKGRGCFDITFLKYKKVINKYLKL
ncbi:elongation factor G [Candidatus Vidania fulgoroideorum]